MRGALDDETDRRVDADCSTEGGDAVVSGGVSGGVDGVHARLLLGADLTAGGQTDAGATGGDAGGDSGGVPGVQT